MKESVILEVVGLSLEVICCIGPNRMAAINKWNIIQDIIENRDYRSFFYFYNENHESTHFSEKEIEKYMNGKSKDFKNKLKALRVLIFYNMHLREKLSEEYKIVLLTDSNFSSISYEDLLSDVEGEINYGKLFAGEEAYQSMNLNIMTTDEFISTQSDERTDGKIPKINFRAH